MDYHTAILNRYLGITGDDFEIWDEGQGPFIKKWNLAFGPTPDLSTLVEDAIFYNEYNISINQRRQQYPPIGDQLDAILKQLNLLQSKDPDLQVIIDRWQMVKADNPLPTRSK